MSAAASGWRALAVLALLAVGCDDGAPAVDRPRDGAPDTVADGAVAPPDAALDGDVLDAAADLAPDAAAPIVRVEAPAAGAVVARLAVRLVGRVDEADRAEWMIAGVGGGPLDPLGFDVVIAAPPGDHILRVVGHRGAASAAAEIPFGIGARLAVGAAHSLAIDDGAVLAWGDNGSGQLGVDVPGRGRPGPTPIEDAVWVAARADGSAAVSADGSLWVWGALTGEATPARLDGIEGAAAVAIGGGHLLILRRDGRVWSVGSNGDGQLGRPDADADSPPGPIEGLTDIVDVAAGSAHSLAVRADGVVFAWGSNADGALGNGETDRDPHPAPQVVGLFGEALDVAAGRGHSVALMADGTVAAWGTGSSGQLGHGQSGLLGDSPTPVTAEALDDAAAVSADGNLTHAVRRGGEAAGWGQNGSGQLGTGDTTGRPRPTAIDLPARVVQIVGGPLHGLALDDGGGWWSWGVNRSGQLGAGLEPDARRSSPVPVR